MTFWSPYLVPRQWLTLPCVWCPATPARQWLSSLVLTSLLVKKLWLRSLRLFFRHLTFKQYKLKTARVWTFPSLVCCVHISLLHKKADVTLGRAIVHWALYARYAKPHPSCQPNLPNSHVLSCNFTHLRRTGSWRREMKEAQVQHRWFYQGHQVAV